MADASITRLNGQRWCDRIYRLAAYWNLGAFLLLAFGIGLIGGMVWSDIEWLGLVQSGWLRDRLCL